MEQLLQRQPYLLGERFTLADASAYGQLGMNMVDPEAADQLRERAPRTWRWLCAVRDAEHVGASGALAVSAALRPLLDIIAETFVPLMQQNAAAWECAVAGGETLFNEAAFDAGRALYEGTLLGRPFCAVAKTFQVAVWRGLQQHWRDLEEVDRLLLEREWLPGAAAAFGEPAGLDT
jgi:hypothetical protein